MRVDIACNDPDNGVFDGRARAVHVGSTEFWCKFGDWAPKLTEGDGWIRIGGLKLQCQGSKYGVGNWCWNGYYLQPSEVERLVNWPKFRAWFDVDQASSGVFERYKAGKPLRLAKRPTPTPTTPGAEVQG